MIAAKNVSLLYLSNKLAMATTISTNIKDYSPAVLSMLPLFYVGWADNELSDREKKLIQDKIGKLSFVDASDRDLMLEWSDPKRRPSDDLIRSWAEIIRECTNHFNPKKKLSLVDLGMEMAKVTCPAGEDERPTISGIRMLTVRRC